MNEFTLRLYTARDSVDSVFLKKLESIAQEYGYYITNEHSSTKHSEQRSKFDADAFLRDAEALRKKIGPVTGNSADDIREMRDEM